MRGERDSKGDYRERGRVREREYFSVNENLNKEDCCMPKSFGMNSKIQVGAFQLLDELQCYKLGVLRSSNQQ